MYMFSEPAHPEPEIARVIDASALWERSGLLTINPLVDDGAKIAGETAEFSFTGVQTLATSVLDCWCNSSAIRPLMSDVDR